MDRAPKSACLGSRAAATVWGHAALWVGLAALALASAGCAVHPYHHFVADDPQSSAGPPAAPSRPASAQSEYPPSPNRAQPEATPVRFDAPRPGDPAPRPMPPAGTKADAPAEKEKPAPTPEAGAPLTLDRAINATLLANPKIRAGLEAINQANADLLTSSLPPNPDLSPNATLLPLNRSFTVDRQGGPPQGGFDVNYPIDWFLFGKRAAAMASAAAGVRVSEADYGDLVRQQVTAAAAAFYDVVEAKALLDLARQDLENLRRVEAAIRKSADAGGKPVVELSRARLEALKSEQELREADKNLVVAKAKLRALIGRRDADPAFDVTGDLDAALTAQPVPVEQALALAERNRPDVRSLRLQIDKADRDVHTEKTKAYPAVTPKLGYVRQFQQKAIGFPDADSYEFSVDVTLPIFDRNQGNIAKARSVRAQNSFNLEAGLVDLRAEVVEVVQEFRTAYQNAGAVGEEQVRLAREVRDIIEKAYQAGGRTLLEALDAEREYRETYRTYINNRANYWRALHRLNGALGSRTLETPDDPRPAAPSGR